MCNNVLNLLCNCVLKTQKKTLIFGSKNSNVLQALEKVGTKHTVHHHTAECIVVSAYIHIKCIVGRMMANLNDLYSVDELKDLYGGSTMSKH